MTYDEVMGICLEMLSNVTNLELWESSYFKIFDTQPAYGGLIDGLIQFGCNLLWMLFTIIPIAFGIAGTFFVSKKAFGWFKSMAK